MTLGYTHTNESGHYCAVVRLTFTIQIFLTFSFILVLLYSNNTKSSPSHCKYSTYSIMVFIEIPFGNTRATNHSHLFRSWNTGLKYITTENVGNKLSNAEVLKQHMFITHSFSIKVQNYSSSRFSRGYIF